MNELKYNCLIPSDAKIICSLFTISGIYNRRYSKQGGLGEYTCTDQQLSDFATDFEYSLMIPVINQTGLAGSFDFHLKWNPSDDQSLNLENLKQALADQLGLELVSTNMPIEMLIVEKAR